MAYEYENKWRPAYEAYAAYAWFIGCFTILYITSSDPHYRTIFLYMAAIMFLFGLVRLLSALQIWNFQDWLTRRSLTFMEPSDLMKRVKKDADKIFVGYGFEWTPVHAQRAYQLLSMDLENTKPPYLYRVATSFARNDVDMKGVPWVHGLNGGEEVQEIDTFHLEGNTMIFGSTGTGKTRLFEILIAQAIHRGEPVIIIDPKGDKDLRNRAAAECKRMNRPRDFLSFHPAFPRESVRIDPLKNWSRATELASRVAALMSSEGSNEAFVAFAWRAINLICQGLIEIEESPNLVKLRAYIEGGPDGLLENALRNYFRRNGVSDLESRLEKYKNLSKNPRNKPSPTASDELIQMLGLYKDKFKAEHSSDVIDGLISMFEHNREHMGKMLASLVPVLSMLTSGSLRELLSPDYNDPMDSRPIADISKVVSMGQVLYMGTDSLTDSTVGGAIGSIVLADLASVAGDRYNYGGRGRVNVFIDESSEVINAPFVQILNKGRGAGVVVAFAAQTIHDFIAKTGNEAMAKQILGNPNNTITLRSKDLETQTYVVETFAKTSIKTLMHTQNTTAIVDSDISNFSGGYGERLIETETDLIGASLVGKLPNLHCVINLSGSHVLKVRLPLLTKERGHNNIADELMKQQLVNI